MRVPNLNLLLAVALLFAGVRFACDAEGRWTLGDRSGRFFAGESRLVRVIWDEPVLDYFIGSGVSCGTLSCLNRKKERKKK